MVGKNTLIINPLVPITGTDNVSWRRTGNMPHSTIAGLTAISSRTR